MLHDVFRKGWWTFKIKVRLICKCFLKMNQTNESYLYFESPPSFSKKHHATYKVLEINFQANDNTSFCHMVKFTTSDWHRHTNCLG